MFMKDGTTQMWESMFHFILYFEYSLLIVYAKIETCLLFLSQWYHIKVVN